MPGAARFGPVTLVVRRPTAVPHFVAAAVTAVGVLVLAYGLKLLSPYPTAEDGARLLVGLGGLIIGTLAMGVLWLVRPGIKRRETVEGEGGHFVVGGRELAVVAAVAAEARDGKWRVDVFDGGRLPAFVATVDSEGDAFALIAAVSPHTGVQIATFRMPAYETALGHRLMVLGTVIALMAIDSLLLGHPRSPLWLLGCLLPAPFSCLFK